MKKIVALSFISLMMVACKPPMPTDGGNDAPAPIPTPDKREPSAPEDAMEEKDPSAMKDDMPSNELAANVSYSNYKDGVVGNGEQSALFFFASWCSKCQANDGKLKNIYGEGAAGINTYKIDFDTADELKQQFGVVAHDTFIVIDGSGKEISRASAPSEKKLREMVAG